MYLLFSNHLSTYFPPTDWDLLNFIKKKVFPGPHLVSLILILDICCFLVSLPPNLNWVRTHLHWIQLHTTSCHTTPRILRPKKQKILKHPCLYLALGVGPFCPVLKTLGCSEEVNSTCYLFLWHKLCIRL